MQANNLAEVQNNQTEEATMRKIIIRNTAVLFTIMAMSCAFGNSIAKSADSAPKKEKGEALKQLEAAAGKKIEDVKVPDVPKPTPVGNSYEVNTSTSSYDVKSSTASSQGSKP
jgi:hypothetical protein